MPLFGAKRSNDTKCLLSAPIIQLDGQCTGNGAFEYSSERRITCVLLHTGKQQQMRYRLLIARDRSDCLSETNTPLTFTAQAPYIQKVTLGERAYNLISKKPANV